MVSSASGPMIGASVKRKEDPRLIMGDSVYTGDVDLRRIVYMAVLRSPYPHARIVNIDASQALADARVLGVLTGEEVRNRCKAQFPLNRVREGTKVKRSWPMAVGTAKYEGEPVAAVVADSNSAARDALERIHVEYAPLPAIVDLEKAAEPGSPLVHEDLGNNVSVLCSGTAGDPESAFREADGVVSARIVMPRLIPNPMESRAVVASYERGTGNMTMWLSTQAPHLERTVVAQMLDLPENKIRILSRDVGGGFGCKIDTYPETVIAAIMAMQHGRPVKWVEDRQEHFLATIHGRGEVQHVEAAYKNDGTLTGLKWRYYTDLGAYSNGGTHSVVEVLTPSGVQGAYHVRNLEWTGHGVFTNKVPVGPYRGYGHHAPAYVIERVMDLIARKLGMDPVDIRRKNFIPPDAFPYMSGMGREYDSGDYEAGLDQVLELAGYHQLRTEQERLRERGVVMGIGVATTIDATAAGPPGGLSARPGFDSASLQISPTGRATAMTGLSPHGQGFETTFAQIVSDELGIPFDEVEVIHGDTAVTPSSTGTRASRSLVIGGTALVMAGREIKEKAVKIAASLLNIDPEHVTLEGGRFSVEDIPGSYVTWADVAERAYSGQTLPEGMQKGLEAIVYWEPRAQTYAYSANVATVIVDVDNGVVNLTGFVAVDDCGTVINPMVVHGQIHGGLAQGIGAALFEQAVFDENGQMLSGSFMDYAMPSAHQLPEFTIESRHTPSPLNPLGAKGMGETPTIAAPPAIANAVMDALAHLGITHLDIPFTPEKVWRAIQEAA